MKQAGRNDRKQRDQQILIHGDQGEGGLGRKEGREGGIECVAGEQMEAHSRETRDRDEQGWRREGKRGGERSTVTQVRKTAREGRVANASSPVLTWYHSPMIGMGMASSAGTSTISAGAFGPAICLRTLKSRSQSSQNAALSFPIRSAKVRCL